VINANQLVAFSSPKPLYQEKQLTIETAEEQFAKAIDKAIEMPLGQIVIGSPMGGDSTSLVPSQDPYNNQGS